MARAFFAWELGGDLGHARRTLEVARELRALGHETAFAFLDLVALGGAGGASLEWFQAPIVAPARTPSHAPLNPSEILLNRGWGDAAGLTGALRGWLGLYALWKPDILVADYAPGAQLAARAAGLRCVAIGSGFSTPIARDPMPAMRSWIATEEGILREIDARLIASVKDAFARIDQRSRAPATAAGLFRAEAELLCTWPEIDPYGPREGAEYLGPQDDPRAGAPASWRGEARPRVFAYLKPRDPRFRALLEALRDLAAEAIIAAPGLAPAEALALCSASIQVRGEALAVEPLLRSADLCVCHAGPGMAARALEAGVPLALLPQQLEQYLVGRRVVSSGAGVMLDPEDKAADFKTWLAQALARDDLRRAAASSPLRGRKPASAALRIARALQG